MVGLMMMAHRTAMQAILKIQRIIKIQTIIIPPILAQITTIAIIKLQLKTISKRVRIPITQAIQSILPQIITRLRIQRIIRIQTIVKQMMQRIIKIQTIIKLPILSQITMIVMIKLLLMTIQTILIIPVDRVNPMRNQPQILAAQLMVKTLRIQLKAKQPILIIPTDRVNLMKNQPQVETIMMRRLQIKRLAMILILMTMNL